MPIRSVLPADRDEWLRLRTALWPHAPETEHLAEVDGFLAGHPYGRPVLAAVFVSEAPDGGLNGLLELSVREYAEGCAGPTPYVEGWYVDAEHRSEGVGRALVRVAEEWARRHGYAELASDAELDNVESQSAHRALGFHEVERAIHFRKDL